MIWLIGKNGMLGTDVESALNSAGQSYLATGRELDIADVQKVENFLTHNHIIWIINCAAYTAVDKAEDEQELAYTINAAGPRNLADAAHRAGAKLIHISTDYVFDGAKDGAYVESDKPCPESIYGNTKNEGEKFVRSILAEHFIIRTAWLFGIHGNNFVYTMLRLFESRNEITVVNDQFGSPTFAPDLAKLIVQIITTDSNKYGTYHFANSGKTTWYEFACSIYKIASERGRTAHTVDIKPVTSAEYPSKVHRPKNSYLSKEKVSRVFDIEVRPWQTVLSDFFDILETVKK